MADFKIVGHNKGQFQMIVRIPNCSKTTVDKRGAEGSLADGSSCQGVGGNLIEKGELRTVHCSKGEN